MENYSYNSSYPESGDSSPRSREIDFENPTPWEDSQANLPSKVKFMCSYGGKIQPRPHDNQLSYVGGETKILAVDRNVKFSTLLSKLVSLSDCDSVSFKYQLPGEDLDALISVTNDDDLEHMMHEYDRLYRVSPKPARLRIFIFSSQGSSLSSSVRSFGSDDGKSEKERFVEALNSAPIATAPPPEAAVSAAVAAPQLPAQAGNVDFLFGLEKANGMAPPNPASVQQPMVGRVQEVEDPVIPGLDGRLVGSDPIQKHIQDLQRLRIEEQQGIYGRKSDENIAVGYAGGDYYRVPEKISPLPVTGGFPYWPEKPAPDGYFPSNAFNNEQPVYMIQAPSASYHSQMMRPVTAPPNQGFYAVQRIPSEMYREQQQMYNVNPPMPVPTTLPPQKVTGYAAEGGFGMVRPGSTAGVPVMVDAAGYAQMAYDRGVGRQVVYTTPGGVMGTPASAVQASQYQAMATAMNADVRPPSAAAAALMSPEPAALPKVVTRTTQGSL
ncbi:uncharacterized protein LOC142554052 [Primulina tabacum]|uniref:uncharacterized protein LOC142554052 n=1 Tax=Primulina tabacum TaxID=48773 RepID=UPI003F599F4D